MIRGHAAFLESEGYRSVSWQVGEAFTRKADGELWVVTAASVYGERELTRWSDGKVVIIMADALHAAMFSLNGESPLERAERVEPKSLIVTEPSIGTAWLDVENGTTTWHVRGVFDRG